MSKQIVCKHGNPAGVKVEPSEVFLDGFGYGQNYYISRITMPVCDQCLMEAVGLSGDSSSVKKETP